MTLAIVNVLPEPVTPISTWYCLPSRSAGHEFFDGLGLIAGGLEGGGELEHAGNSIARRMR